MIFMDNEDVRVSLLMPKDLKEEVEKKAKNMGLSFSAYVRMVLIKDIKK